MDHLFHDSQFELRPQISTIVLSLGFLNKHYSKKTYLESMIFVFSTSISKKRLHKNTLSGNTTCINGEKRKTSSTSPRLFRRTETMFPNKEFLTKIRKFNQTYTSGCVLGPPVFLVNINDPNQQH